VSDLVNMLDTSAYTLAAHCTQQKTCLFPCRDPNRCERARFPGAIPECHPPSRNSHHHSKSNYEERDDRRLDAEREYLGRDSRLKMDIDRHKHHQKEA
jgi:hypothetical protein